MSSTHRRAAKYRQIFEIGGVMAVTTFVDEDTELEILIQLARVLELSHYLEKRLEMVNHFLNRTRLIHQNQCAGASL